MPIKIIHRHCKYFLVGVSGMYANRTDLSGDQSALTFKVDYPNDIWDLSLTFLRIGDAFDPSPGFTHNIGRLPFGNFDQTLIGLRVRLNASPDLQLNSFVQYDTDTKSLGINARIHWIFHPQGDIYLVFNHNTFEGLERWELISQQVLLKARYNFRLSDT